jgi:hypothetical protein
VTNSASSFHTAVSWPFPCNLLQLQWVSKLCFSLLFLALEQLVIRDCNETTCFKVQKLHYLQVTRWVIYIKTPKTIHSYTPGGLNTNLYRNSCANHTICLIIYFQDSVQHGLLFSYRACVYYVLVYANQCFRTSNHHVLEISM